MKTALQGVLAMIKRRRALFVADAAALGYPPAAGDELVFWTYVYYNPGSGNGKESLTRHKGARKLGDWITRGEYPNAQTVLKSYRMLRAMNIFP